MAGKGQLTINNLVIVKVVFPSPGSPRRTYCPAYGGACVRYAYGEGTTPCWAAAARQGGARGAGRRENDRVARFRASRNSPPYCRFRPAGRARLRAFPSLKGRGRAVPPFHYFLARPRSFARALPPKAVRGARGRAGAGHKARPGGPTNLAAAAGRRGFARRWGERPAAEPTPWT